MIFKYDDSVKLALNPTEWNINSPKEVLQFAVCGMLYMPGTNVKIVDDIINHHIPRISSICLCLEDAIGDDMVKKAEGCVKHILRGIYNAVHEGRLDINDVPLIFVRVREPKQITRLFKLCGTRAFSVLSGFNLPKFDRGNCDDYLHEFEGVLKANMKSNKRPLYIMPIIESKNVMYRQRRMDQLIYINDRLVLYSDYVLNIRVGATDFCSLFGIRRNIKSNIYDMNVIADCLADVVNVFARNYIVSGPVWEFFNSHGIEGEWSEGLKRELFLDKLNGFTGKTCIHPSQLKYIQENCIPTYEQYKDATAILGMADGLKGVKKGYGGNKMNEVKTHSTWAKRVIGLAEIFGVLAEEPVDNFNQRREKEDTGVAEGSENLANIKLDTEDMVQEKE